MAESKKQKISITLKNDSTYTIELKDGQSYSVNSEHQTFEVFDVKYHVILFMSDVIAVVTDKIKFTIKDPKNN